VFLRHKPRPFAGAVAIELRLMTLRHCLQI
jgi:hypothetical protein